METGVPKLKKLGLIATVFIVLAYLLVFAASPVYAQSWDSYNDSPGGTQDDTFSDNEVIVYMYGTDFTQGTTYKVVYYEADTDGGGTDDTADIVDIEYVYSPDGSLESDYYFPSNKTADPGEWHSVVYPSTVDPPSVYTSTDSDIIVDDLSAGTYSFYVNQEVIPEFPTVIAMIVAMGLSFGIYYWMRQRYHRKVVTA